MAGFVPNMYAVQHTGYLELELADWKDARLLVAFQCQMIYFHFYISLIQFSHTWIDICIVHNLQGNCCLGDTCVRSREFLLQLY